MHVQVQSGQGAQGMSAVHRSCHIAHPRMVPDLCHPADSMAHDERNLNEGSLPQQVVWFAQMG